MTTPRIEEIKDKAFSKMSYLGKEGVELEEVYDLITQAHQAGIDGAVALLKEKRNGHCGKKDCLQAYCINRKIIREFCDDTIKALQDKK